jgi:hypothetical protein
MEQIKVKTAVKKAGGPTRLARLLKVSRNSVYRWQRANQPLPELYLWRYQRAVARGEV